MKHKGGLVEIKDSGVTAADGKWACGYQSADGRVKCSKTCDTEQAVLSHRKTHTQKPKASAGTGIASVFSSPKAADSSSSSSSSAPALPPVSPNSLSPPASELERKADLSVPALAPAGVAAFAPALGSDKSSSSASQVPESSPAGAAGKQGGEKQDGRVGNRGAKKRKQYTYLERSRILDKFAAAKRAGVKAAGKVVAEEEGLSPGMLSQWVKNQASRRLCSVLIILFVETNSRVRRAGSHQEPVPPVQSKATLPTHGE